MDAVRSMLFTPGHRPDLIAKASRSAADAVIVDLEDAVATSAKDQARSNLASLPAGALPYFVRLNGFATAALWEDLVAAADAGAEGVILPKAESRQVMLKVCGALSVLETAAGRPGRLHRPDPDDRDGSGGAKRLRDPGRMPESGGGDVRQR